AGDRLRLCLRAGDTPARIGGDEFAALLEGSAPDDVRVVADRVVATLAAPVAIGTASVTISASVGMATADAGEAADDLLRRADAALYAAKRAGKNRVLLAATP
ncbi:MAG TPA: GGDEF domain-containing protein, partial [Thermomicrobiales bacterium]